jgi:glycosyltransferase involved in cell wall biosynthesis
MVTVLTPTYNRAKLLPRLYDSLCKQTSKDFEWLIVDDGSTDETEQLCKSLLRNKSDFSIKYIKKDNGGKHTAINLGVKEAHGELFFIADSDDWLPSYVLQTVNDEWITVKDNLIIGGICGLDADQNNEIIGSGLPRPFIDESSINIRYKYHVTGDMKEVFRTSILREFPFPEIDKEKFCPEMLVWNRIAQKYKLHYINKIIYSVEYQSNGITSNIVRVRMQSPVASMMTYAEMLGYNIPLREKFKAAINYWRFRFCYKGKEQPMIALKWYPLALLGYLMHFRDIRRMGSC